MVSVIVVFPKQDDAMNIRRLLVQNGVDVTGVCTTGAQAIHYMDGLDGGIVVCGYKFSDMMYTNLHDCLPQNFEMLLVASQHLWSECIDNDIVCVAMPIKIRDLINTLEMMLQTIARSMKKQRERMPARSVEDKETILYAKKLLMERNNMSEEEAHRYIQKSSMDTGTNMVETAQMVLTLMR